MSFIRSTLALPFALSLLASGCTSMSGLDGSSSYSCPLPKSGNCKPMSQVYEESVAADRGGDVAAATTAAQGDLLPVVDASPAAVPAPPRPALADTAGSAFTIPGLPAPLLTRPRVLRVYIAPWADNQGTLLEGRKAYLKLDDGRWRLEHFRANERKAFAPILPPSAAAPVAPEPVASAVSKPFGLPTNPFMSGAMADRMREVQGRVQ